MLATRARDNSCWIAFVNAVGAQDELIFDGQSLVLDENGEVVVRGPAFEEALLLVDVDATTAVARRLRDARRRSLARAPRELPEAQVDRRPVAPDSAAGARCAHGRRAAGRAGGDAARDRARPRATTPARTASRTSCWGSPAGSTRRSPRRSPSRRSGREHVVCVSMPSRFSSRGDAARRAGRGRVARRALPRDPHRPRGRRIRRGARRGVRGHRARDRRGERPGTGARRDRDGALEQVRLARRSRPGTRASSPSATRRSTATWPAASPSSRTSTRRTSSGWRAT